MCDTAESADMTIIAADIESAYWAALKRIRHQGLPEVRSWIIEAEA